MRQIGGKCRALPTAFPPSKNIKRAARARRQEGRSFARYAAALLRTTATPEAKLFRLHGASSTCLHAAGKSAIVIGGRGLAGSFGGGGLSTPGENQ